MSGKEKICSVLVAAVAGSSKLSEKRGGAEATHAVERCRKRMARGVEGFRGQLLPSKRDELTALFEDADDACQAAIAMQRRIADLPPVSGVQLAIRVGFHHGPLREDGAGAHGEGLRIAESLANQASPGQTLTSGKTRTLLSTPLQAVTRCLPPPLESKLPAADEVFEVAWLETRAAFTKKPPSSPSPLPLPPREGSLRLCVRYGGQVRLLDKTRARVDMGRDANCAITIRDRRASRNHATIERRGEHFVLSDLSTNGTFVTVSGEKELFLRCEEFVLRGSGIIAFAASASSPSADIAEFEHL
ncbi:MAG: type VI secretion system FHA domain protein [Candidatus Accumulibacter appositus]|uniref:Type VI secretion system FHA domain protein n=1 Tax=Candidatus Accumulibacter appositus TaxID=1454003 RepID=A0A011NUN4_9PROT|nr:adenylate/guanylate cyclase domain-containing protein [Accumulibacter sp.]EXI79046.1 MAG: type VI secretion system FHA domain protein [Candidatus Accumulibacter appositus]HRF03198.1 adenylate/guanylate cyclase domain-containing protein [Accumulibacter sp.]